MNSITKTMASSIFVVRSARSPRDGALKLMSLRDRKNEEIECECGKNENRKKTGGKEFYSMRLVLYG